MKKLRTDEFILRAKGVHGDRYDYTKTNYVNGRTKVNIICPKHGVFQQLPKNHLYLKQDYHPIKYFGGSAGLKYIQLNDKIKSDFAENNDINLLRIKYDDMKSLFEILENNLILK